MSVELLPLRVLTGDVLHQPPPGDHRWTTRNFSEAVPGVPTALTWSIWGPGMDVAGWWTYLHTGMFSRREIEEYRQAGQSASGIFYGHVAGNVDVMSQAVARTPGQDVALFEKDFFGLEPSDRTPRSTLRRLPWLATKGARLVRAQPGRLDEVAAAANAWWVARSHTDLSVEEAAQTLADAKQRFATVMAIHAFQSSLSQAAYGKVAKLAADAGHPGLELRLVSGQGHTAEVDVARDLWSVSRGTLTQAEFFRRHGYHGPDEGELSSPSWRQDPTPIEAAVRAFRERPDDDSPAAHVQRQTRQAREAEHQLLGGLGRVARARAAKTISKARTTVPRREIGKTAFLQVLDVARHAAVTIGRSWADAGRIESPTDVFHLTVEEINDEIADPRPLIAERRKSRDRYSTMELPEQWCGPDPDTTTREMEGSAAADVGTVISGIAAAPGSRTGTARVIVNRGDARNPLTPDEILVTRTTDPGWVSVFMDAGGMVVDVGGAMSHAAIVARELGVPCIINTVDGTDRIPDGATITIDGDAGIATLVAVPPN